MARSGLSGVFYHASLILNFGLTPPLGIVWVEQYLTQSLAMIPLLMVVALKPLHEKYKG